MADDEVAERLRNLVAVTDASLSRLDVEDLLLELLERVRGILDVDTAAVLLVAEESDELVARAARGLEEEVRQGFRVPVGVGFAGSVAAGRVPVILDRVDETTVVNPILYEKGVQVMLGVPLWSDGDVIGVLHVGRLERRPFSTPDVELLQVVADRVASAAQARRLAVERAAAALLERSLLPPRFPDLPGVSFAARYIPGEGRAVGGDWYDCFLLPNGQLWCVVGDVAGHGLTSAVVMGRIRSALRAYALATGSVQQTMELTDRKMLHFEVGTIATVICAVAEAPYDSFQYCSAGHPPPAVATPGQASELLSLPVGPPLGAFADITREVQNVALPAGASLLLYTDGLIERRDETLDDGFARLLAAMTPATPDQLCRTVLHSLLPDSELADDVTVLAIHAT